MVRIRSILLLLIFSTVVLDTLGQSPTSKEVILYFAPVGSKGFIRGLTKDQVDIKIGGKPANLFDLSEASEPAMIGFLVDTSASMKNSLLKDPSFFNGLGVFFDSLGTGNSYFLSSLADGEIISTGDPNLIKQGIFDVRKKGSPGGNTRLFDAMSENLDRFSGTSFQRKILIIISDGEDNVSKIHFEDLRTKFRKSDVECYFINVFTTGRTRDQFVIQSEAEARVGELVTNTGGGTHNLARPEHAVITFRALAYQIGNWYKARVFAKTDFSKQKLRDVKVTIKSPDRRDNNFRISARHQIYL